MKYFKSIITLSVLLFAPAYAQDKEAEALRDLQLGLQGIQEAAKNPALLAQLMQDLQVCSPTAKSNSRAAVSRLVSHFWKFHLES